MSGLEWAALLATTAFAALAQGAVGFGFAILVVPAYFLLLDSLAAVQLTIVSSLFSTAVLAPRLWASVPGALLARLIAGAALGLPLGLLIYRALDVDLAKTMAGGLLCLFALHGLLRPGSAAPRAEVRARPWLDLGIGLVSGLLTTSLAMPGPVVVLYLLMAGCPRDVMRATALSLFVFSYACSLLLQLVGAGIDPATWQMAALTAPLAAAGALSGHHLARHLAPATHRRAAFALLVLTGLLAAATALS